MTLKRALPLFAGLAFALFAQPALAQYAIPGGACTTNGVLANSNGFLTCTGGYWVVNPVIAASLSVGTNTPLVSVDLSNKTDALALPIGTTGTRPSGGALVNGEIRYNSTLGTVEAYVNGAWASLLSGSGTGTSIPAAGSTGYVQFNTSNALNADSGFVWDNTNKRLGLGTSAPTTLLDVGAFTGTASITLHVASATGYDSTLKLMETSDNYGFTIKNSNGSTGLTGLNILRHNNSATGTSALFIGRTTGYVGIGTTAPAYPLSIVENASPALLITGVSGINYGNADFEIASASGTGQWSIATSDSTGSFSLWDVAHSKGPLIIETNTPSNTVYVGSSGYVGIGTASPASRLQVYDDGAKTADYTGAQINALATASNDLNKVGLRIDSTGTWGGMMGTNIGLLINVAGAASNLAAKINGAVIISATGPAYALDVTGWIRSTMGIVFPDGTTQTTAASGGGVPAGAVMHFAMSTCPSGWLAANGSTASRTTYSSLFAAVGTTYGTGDGSTTFTLPDLRGTFVRGWDNGRGLDSGRTFGTYQADAFASHSHSFTTRGSGSTSPKMWAADSSVGSTTTSTAAAGGSETRPKNVAMQACIKY